MKKKRIIFKTKRENSPLSWLTAIFLRTTCGLFVLIMLGFISGGVNASTLTHIVGPQDNLYFDDWGHPWKGGPSQSEFGALGTGITARSVSDTSVPINFSGMPSLDVSASGAVQDSGSTFTNADGFSSLFRGLRVYSMIGIWSSTSSSITPIGTAFFVGTSNTLTVPVEPSAYLFLGENDGNFSDNFSGQYNVRLNVVPVPEPFFMLLFGTGLVGVCGYVRRKLKG